MRMFHNIFVPGFRHKAAAGQLYVVVIRPYRDYLKFFGLVVIVDLEVVCAVFFVAETAKLAAFLEGHALHKPTDLIVVGVERQVVVFEVVDGEVVAVFALLHLAAHAADRPRAPRVYVGKGIGFVMVNPAVFVCIDLDIALAAGQLQAAVSVCRGIDVARTAHGPQPRIEFHIVGFAGVYRQQSVVIAHGYGLAVFAPADVDCLTLDPPFDSDFLGYLFQRLVAVFSLIVDGDVLGAVYLPDLPVGDVAHAVVHTVDYHRYMLSRRRCQREHGVVFAIDALYHQDVPYQALDAVQGQVIAPFFRRFLLGAVPLGQPVTLALVVCVVVHIEFHMLVQRERQRQHVVAAYLFRLCRTVVGRQLCAPLPGFVIYRQHHVLCLFYHHYNTVISPLEYRLGLAESHLEAARLFHPVVPQVRQRSELGAAHIEHPQRHAYRREGDV